MTTCPAAITIAGIEYFCQNDSNSHHLPSRHWTTSGQPTPTYWTQDVMPPPKPLTLVEWLRQEVPYDNLHNDYSIGYRAGRMATLTAAERWAPFVPAPVDLNALVEAIRPHTYGKVMPTTMAIAEAVLKHLGLEAK